MTHITSNKTKTSTMKHIRFKDTLLDQIETDNFSKWVMDACLEKLEKNSLLSFLKEIVPDLKENYYELTYGHILPMYAISTNVAFKYVNFNELDFDYTINHTARIEIEECLKVDIKLIYIYEDEWLSKPEIVKTMILYNLGKLKNIGGARKFTIKDVSKEEATVFLNKYHIQGFMFSKVKLGLYSKDNTLSALMSFGQCFSHRGKVSSDEWELNRFAAIGAIPGGASKLLSHFIKNYNPSSIISYSDNRWFGGGLYTKLGFVKSHESRPDYEYIKDGVRYHKSNFRKEKIKVKYPEYYDVNKTEREMMIEAGYKRVHNAGRIAWLKNIVKVE